MSAMGEQPDGTGERLRRLEAVTDAALSHLDLDELLTELLDRVRELLSVDTAAVLMLNRSGRFLVAAAARGLEEEVRQGVQIPVGAGFAGRIAADKRPVAIEQVDHTNVLNPILRDRGIRSLLGVPLLDAGAVLGVLHVGTLTTRRFTDGDARLLQAVADRIALAIQARTRHSERIAAATLQRSLLPDELPDVPGLEFASRYVTGEGSVGGDWYDVFTLPSGTLCTVVGDVVGRGLGAAQAMGRIRDVLRGYAMDTEDPAELLAKLDRQVRYFQPEMLASTWCAMIDPAHLELRMSTAGHPPPMLARLGQPTTMLDLPADPLIGIGSNRTRHTTTVDLPPGAVLCAYTDGLVERRGVPLDVGLELLRQAVTTGTPETICATVMAKLIGPHAPGDDIAVLVLSRTDPRGPGHD
jgi:serine phosphatase RsbU (regulator of sigma subunit)